MIVTAFKSNILLVAASVLVTLALASVGVALAWGANDQAELAQVARTNCMQIEALKTQFRNQAVQSYRHLEQNARILGIEVTPELRQEAQRGRDEALRRFARSEC